MLETAKRARIAVATAVAGGSLAAVTIGAFAATGSPANSAFQAGCGVGVYGYGYTAATGYGYQSAAGYGACPTSPAPSVSPSPIKSSPAPAPVCNPLGKQHTPDVALDGGKIFKGQRKGLTARCLRPGRKIKVFSVVGGHTKLVLTLTVNKYGTVRFFYRPTAKGSLELSFSGAAFDGKILRKKFFTTVK